jgi:hypothetical protein
MMHENANKGILITTSDFSKKAVTFAQYKAIELINGNSILSLLNKHLKSTEAQKNSNTYNSIEMIERNSILSFLEKRLAEARDRGHLSQHEHATSEQSSNPGLVFADLVGFDKEAGITWTRDANLAGERICMRMIHEIVSALNNEQYAGYNDWRMPTGQELKTLISITGNQISFKGCDKNVRKLLNDLGFKNVQADCYWSSTTYSGGDNDDTIWAIDMHNGAARMRSKSKSNIYLWPVRGGKDSDK